MELVSSTLYSIRSFSPAFPNLRVGPLKRSCKMNLGGYELTNGVGKKKIQEIPEKVFAFL